MAESDSQQGRIQQRQQSRSQPDSRAGVSQTAEPESDRQQSRSQLRQQSRSQLRQQSRSQPDSRAGVSHDPEAEDDMRPVLNLVEQDELLCKEIAECAAETMLIVETL